MQQRINFDVILYVPAEWADFVARQLFKFLNQMLCMTVIESIEEKKIKKVGSHIYIIDGSYLLRMFLELFLIDKKNRVSIIRDLFTQGSNSQLNGKIGMSFKNFRKMIIEIISSLTEAQIYQIYRDLRMIGNGLVTYDVFVTYALDRNLFVSGLKLPKWFD